MQSAYVSIFFTLEKDTIWILERLDKMVPVKQAT